MTTLSVFDVDREVRAQGWRKVTIQWYPGDCPQCDCKVVDHERYQNGRGEYRAWAVCGRCGAAWEVDA